MVQLTELKPPDFGAIADQFTSINFSFPVPSFAFPTDLLGAKFDALTGVVDNFGGLVQNLPTSLDDLLGDLLGELKSLSGGSLEIGNLLGGLTTPFTSAAPVFNEFQTVFTTLSTDLFPALLHLRDQPVDAAALAQLLPITALAAPLTTQLSSVLAPQLQQVQQARSHLTSLITQPPLTDYQAILEAIATLPLDPSLTADQLPTLDEHRIAPLKTQIDTLQQKAQAATDDLQRFQQSLAGVPTALNASLDTALSRLSPQQLAQEASPLGSALSSLDSLGAVDFGGAVSKIQAVIQPLQTLIDRGVETATTGVNTVVQRVDQAIATADQALVKVSALVTNVIDQLVGFVQKIDLTSLINQAKDIFQGLMLKLNGVLNQVGGVIEQIYTFVRGMVDKVKVLGEQLPPLAEKLRQILAQITVFLENPQVKNAVQQAKQGIDLVVQKLDAVSLEPVFDQVLAQVDTVKTSLQAIDLAQLNQMLKSALSAALDLVRGAIDPPSKITDLVKEQYNTLIGDPIIGGIVQPVKQQIDSVVNLIHQLEPGTLVGAVLTPLYEQALASVKHFVDPDQIASLLQPLTDFQTNLLKQIDAVINPSKLLAPLMGFYGQIMDFVRSLTPEQILAPLNALLNQATQPLESLGLEQLVSSMTTSVRNVTHWISTLNIDDQFLDQGIAPLLESWIQNLKAVVNQLDLSGLKTLLQPLRTVANSLLDQTRLDGTAPLELAKQVQQMVAEVQQYATQYGEQMSKLAQIWKTGCDRLESFTPSADLQSQYDALKTQLKSLNPITLLATSTQILDRLGDMAAAILDTLKAIWQGLGDRLQHGRKYLDYLIDEEADGLKTYLNQAIDALMDSALRPLIQTLDKPLKQMKGVMQSIRQLQGSLQVFELIPQSMQTIGAAIIGIKNKIRAFNFNFLIEPLGRVMDEIERPLEALNPEPVLIVPLTQVYNKVLKMVENLNPVSLFSTARGTITFKAEIASAPLTLPLGTQLAATTPLGDEVWFETLLEGTVPVGGQVDLSIRAMVSGRSSDIVGVDGVTWRVVDQPDLQATHTQPILSLITIVQEELLGILNIFDPVTLIAEPLNEQYEKIVQLFDELGIAKLFDTFFKKMESIDQEIEAGLDRLGGAFGGLVKAMPL